MYESAEYVKMNICVELQYETKNGHCFDTDWNSQCAVARIMHMKNKSILHNLIVKDDQATHRLFQVSAQGPGQLHLSDASLED